MEAAAAAGVQLGSLKPQIITQVEMAESRVLLACHDHARTSEFYLSWKCEPECHAYEKCQYELVIERMLQMQKICEAQEAKHHASG
ncbi:LOW QUALITY PROTEIN: hypothetical protein SETIT_5G106200v2 [Setaria italica]|uniref:Uncharacterized protein n=2 Tax=Setaria italica TaxID=4555 RepID=A0A368R3G5_SETIT|nr:LOW QUALITY PROTEIN: hypothetical protein SETIT_5G106200v2 [Setaria italica]